MPQRSKRLPALTSPATLLSEVAPAYHAITRANSGLVISGAHYQALERAREALALLAAELGRPEHFLSEMHRTP